YGFHSKGHRANGFTTDGGFAEYAVNHINTIAPIPDSISDEQATLIVTAGTAIYGLDVLGGLIAGESVVITGAGAIGLMACAVAKVLGAGPVIITDIRDDRLEMGKSLGADFGVNASKENPVEAVHRITNGGADLALECSGAKSGFDDAVHMVTRGGRVCLAAFAHEPVLVDAQHMVANNIYVYGIRAEGQSATLRAAALLAQGKFDPAIIHTHTFPMSDVPTAIRYARDRVEDAIKVVVKMR
ncbi:MAG: zinc-binding dehydrogenase, partial [Rhodospirillales bacterium]|nr:zinc-binding dehydrogenase [Rhodospirillales bacterium]